MPLKEELEAEVARTFKTEWSSRDGKVVPADSDVGLGNDAVKLKATVLYADLADSTELVATKTAEFSAEIYKTFLHCAAKIIKAEGGSITAYDGDRIMAIFIGDSKNTTAVRTALKINWAVINIIRPAQKKQYPDSTYVLKHKVGIDTSDVFVARTGVRGANDLVWVGTSANNAAKMAALPATHATRISSAIYNNVHDQAKISSGTNMWESASWDGATIYRSTYMWAIT